MYVVLVLILLFLLVRERQLETFVRIEKLCQFFHKKSGSQEDNQASIFGHPHSFCVHGGHFNFATL